MSILDQMLQAQLLHTNESSLSTAKEGGTPKTEKKQYHKEAVSGHPECSLESSICATSLLLALGKEINAASASNRKAERAG
jgi:hypothetical protein